MKKLDFFQKINDAESFIRQIEKLLSNKKLASKMKFNCIKESKKYDWEKICITYLNLYKTIIERNKK